uniref:Semaphorin 4A n=1 Tax=Anser cygnoides TaxID=8845 RepID=A0A8B9ES82_ANSCY
MGARRGNGDPQREVGTAQRGLGKKLPLPHPSGPAAALGRSCTSSASPHPALPLPGDPRRTLTRFSQDNVSHYDIFLLSEGEEELYVGARDRVLALAVGAPGTIHAKASITWGPTAEKTSECAFKKKSRETECFNFIRVLVALNQTHLYVCGTYAFSPACTYIVRQPFLDGKGQCPFDPQHTYTALLVDGELYAGTMNNFQGNEPIISRSLGSRTLLKTDAFLRWLSADAAFVASVSIPSDDKVYFFFEETADEFDFFERLLVPRVARVCKSDVGGDKVLQKKWTTFLKAQLVCSQPGRFPFNVIHHAFALPRRGGGGADFYAVFTSQWQAGRAGSAAVCVYSQEALEKVFEGKYKELNKESSRWTVYSGPSVSPRPGSCSMGPSSDKALTFMKDHFLMDGKVAPAQGQPLLVKTDVKYTRIAVDETHGTSGAVYRVMFLATEEGFLHKAVELPAGPHIVESIQLFSTPEPVKNLLLAPGKVGDGDRDGDGERERDRGWGQGGGRRGRQPAFSPAGLSPPLNAVVRLPCPRHSALATYSWQQPGGWGGSALLPNHTLVVIMQRGSAGTYTCQATENGYTWPVARYRLQDPSGAAPQDGLAQEAAPGSPRSYWPQFVTVTVLLAVTLAAAGGLALAAYCDQLKAKSKVQGCGVPRSPPGRPREKAPLNGGAREPPAAGEEERGGSRACCLQLDGDNGPGDSTDTARLPDTA